MKCKYTDKNTRVIDVEMDLEIDAGAEIRIVIDSNLHDDSTEDSRENQV